MHAAAIAAVQQRKLVRATNRIFQIDLHQRRADKKVKNKGFESGAEHHDERGKAQARALVAGAALQREHGAKKQYGTKGEIEEFCRRDTIKITKHQHGKAPAAFRETMADYAIIFKAFTTKFRQPHCGMPFGL
ncbi:MAG: hypothetical protein PW788_08115 [Micavibrio sp.]|nr:hypothetical protein [Micavibrio sp.]